MFSLWEGTLERDTIAKLTKIFGQLATGRPETVAKLCYRARLSGNRIGWTTGPPTKARAHRVTNVQGRSGQPSRRTRDQAEPETVRSALAWYGREKTAKGAL